MKNLETPEIWYLTGSQHLNDEATLNHVAAHSQKIVEELNGSQRLPLKLAFKPTLTRPKEISALCLEVNYAPNCAGLILWMHIFSPAVQEGALDCTVMLTA
jgi:L-arabinose isomerase